MGHEWERLGLEGTNLSKQNILNSDHKNVCLGEGGGIEGR